VRLSPHRSPRPLTGALERRAGARVFVERGVQLIKEVGRHDRESAVLEEHLLSAALGSRTSEVAGSLVDEVGGTLDPALCVGADAKLKPRRCR
jgi:hypothetical protein